jgi:hypothetical protein
LRRWPLLWNRIIRRQQRVHPSPAALHRLRPNLLHTSHVLSLLLSKMLRLKHRTILSFWMAKTCRSLALRGGYRLEVWEQETEYLHLWEDVRRRKINEWGAS